MKKPIKIRTNLLAGIVMGVVAIVLLLFMPSQVRLPLFDSGAPSPRIIPGICLVGILICSAILLIQSLVFHKEHIYEFRWEEEKPEIILILAMIAFTVLTHFLGFVIAGILVFCWMQWFEGERKPFIYIYTVAAVILIYALFLFVFHIDLPAGPLGNLF